jgi:D-arabinose 1-dehydrogenase-like Zn-dependent alcohol dehydrogenase
MRARFIERWDGPLLEGEWPDPEPGPGEVLIDVEACGVGLTVLNCIRGDLGDNPADLPRVPGHEFVGTVARVGAGVDADLIGSPVMAYFYLCCARCRRCRAGHESLCERLAGYVGVNRDGGYAERAILPVQNVVALPQGVDPVAATAIPDAIATPLHLTRRAAIAPGERVAVIAAGGGVGIHMVQVARLFGADVAGLEAAPAKLEFLDAELGVQAVDSSDFDTVRLPAAWSHGADVVVDLLGTERSLAWSLGALAPGGRLVVLTTFRGPSFDVAPRDLVLRQASVVASRYAGRAELELGAQLVAEHRVRPIVSRSTGPSEVDELHDALRRGELLGRGALRWT